SGYQLDNLDENHLPSLQSILKDNGYHTIMINVEPYNPDFSGYLEAMGFDEVLTLYDGLRGLGNTIADVDAYKLIFETMQEQPSDTPFFLCIYTFGTHESLGSVDAIFGETEVKELDKFYNVDLAFGDFMDQFKNSDLYDNTVIVFTADHCTYGDKDFATYFSYRERIHTMLDQMPLMIYYKDVEPETIDVNGRNTLCLAPTLLDLLDISGENMFLGSSLFSNEHTGILETCTVIDRGMSCTEGGILRPYSAEEEEELMVPITEYFKVKLR
ncbi:MAG: sulfatase-like hydrolase/transferase, partial [Lachnospiraceae bacterium]|nr:sulfatase-like hydrolase/transferase [Lachnospiraceae bacterium]